MNILKVKGEKRREISCQKGYVLFHDIDDCGSNHDMHDIE